MLERRRKRGSDGEAKVGGWLVGLVIPAWDMFVMNDALSRFHKAKLNHIYFSLQHQTRSVVIPLLLF